MQINALTLGRQAVTPKNICPDSGENPVTLKQSWLREGNNYGLLILQSNNKNSPFCIWRY